VDVIDEVEEVEFMNGLCKRVSVFMSIFDVHVQRSPVAGTLSFTVHHPGEFLNALNLESSARNENLLLGFESNERPGEKIAVRLVAGLIARRIVPWAVQGDTVERGERLSLIQYGSRCDIYLPLTANVRVKLGDHLVAGQSIVAVRT
jgi:phosphatidylserine decarboxylase